MTTFLLYVPSAYEAFLLYRPRLFAANNSAVIQFDK
jgi:hypothetical protein